VCFSPCPYFGGFSSLPLFWWAFLFALILAGFSLCPYFGGLFSLAFLQAFIFALILTGFSPCPYFGGLFSQAKFYPAHPDIPEI
jgi:hypothetical protein